MKRVFFNKRGNATGFKNGNAGASVLGIIPTFRTFLVELFTKLTGRRIQNRRISLAIDTTPRKEHWETLREEMLAEFDKTMSQIPSTLLECSLHDEDTVNVEAWRNSPEFPEDPMISSECNGEAPMDEDEIRILQHLSGVILDTEPSTEHREQLRAQVLAVFDESDESKSHQKLEQIIEDEKPFILGSHGEAPAQKPTQRWHSSAKKLIKITKTVSFRYAAAAVFLIGLVGFFSYLSPGTAQASTDFAAVLHKIREANSVSYTETVYREGQKSVESKNFCTKGKWVRTLPDGTTQTFDYKNSQLIITNPKTKKKVKVDLTKLIQNNLGAVDYLSFLKKLHKDAGSFVKQRRWENHLVNEFHVKGNGYSTIIFADAKSDFPVYIKIINTNLSTGSQYTTVMTNMNWNIPE